MNIRKRGNSLEKWEVALVRAMVARGQHNDQGILAYFTRPTRTVNHRLIGQIRKGQVWKTVNAASQEELTTFLGAWPNIDPATGLNVRGDELLIKAREAMIAAVQTFNSPSLIFRSELFIVTAIIAWTYLLHAYFKREDVDYRYYKMIDGQKILDKTPEGADRYWDLSYCLRHSKCPLEKGMINNLKALITIRHEIEHRSTEKIDGALCSKLQQCCINFNDSIRSLFGEQYGLDNQLSIALQFVTFTADQQSVLKEAQKLPRHLAITLKNIHDRLTDEELSDPRFSFHVAFIRKTANRASAADEAIEFITADSSVGQEVSRILLKETERPKFKPSHVVRLMNQDGYRRFNMATHTELWQSLDARNPNKSYGVNIAGQWYWYESWISRVREHCAENQSKYV